MRGGRFGKYGEHKKFERLRQSQLEKIKVNLQDYWQKKAKSKGCK